MPFSDAGRRLDLPEWMDGPCSEQQLRDCLCDIEEVNDLLLVYRPTLQWLEEIFAASPQRLHIVDVGCGGGDMLRTIERWARQRSLPIELTGVDMNERTLRFAHARTPVSSCIRYVHGSAAGHPDVRDVDVVISSHMAHHLTDGEIVRFLQWMECAARVGWFVNDLHRERFPYLSFRLLAACMGWHRFVRHDGPISVLRSFQPEDWRRYLCSAGIEGASLRTIFPGRLCLARRKLNA